MSDFSDSPSTSSEASSTNFTILSSSSCEDSDEVPGRFGSWFRCTSLDKRPTRSFRSSRQNGDPTLSWRQALPDWAWAFLQLLLLIPVLTPELLSLAAGSDFCAEVVKARKKHLGGGIERAMRFSVLVYSFSGLVNIAANLFISLRMRLTFLSASGESKMLSTEASVCSVLSLSWLLDVLSAASCACTWCFPGIPGIHLGFLLNVATTPTLLFLVAAFIRSIRLRLQLLEVGYGEDLGARWLLRWVRCLVAMAMVATAWHISSYVARGVFGEKLAFVISRRDLGAQGTQGHDQFAATVVFLSFSVTSAVTLWAFSRMEQSLQPAMSSDLGAYIKAEAAWAKSELRNARLAVLLTCHSAAIAALVCIARPWILGMCSNDDDRCYIAYQLVVPVLELGAVLVEIISLFALLGIFSDKPPDIRIASPARRLSQGAARLNRLDSATDEWWATARGLASRSISLQELLRFWASLGPADPHRPGSGMMPHYDVERSTTNDVVRQAIIPMSRVGDGGVSLAEVLQEDSEVKLPHAMVTHSWRNNFRDLVAAIIADAGKKDQYWLVASKLNRARDSEGMLRKLHSLNQRYWVCAFCVNQHASICGEYAPAPPREDASDFERWWVGRHDTVKEVPLPICNCRQPKLSSLKDPARCELNKFDDMMTVLHDSVPGFRQVVAVDRQLDVFQRAWCVAELVEASRADMQQAIQVHKTAELDIYSADTQAYAKLATLSVRDCCASRPEDKEVILAKIGDTEEFDAKLHTVIFGQHGLLGRRFHGFGALDAAARTARRVKAVCELRRKDDFNSA